MFYDVIKKIKSVPIYVKYLNFKAVKIFCFDYELKHLIFKVFAATLPGIKIMAALWPNWVYSPY